MKKTNRISVVTRFFFALTTPVVAMLATEANGAWSDNFDSYSNGSTIIGQGAWVGWELAESGDNDTTVSNAQASSGDHSLMMGDTPYVDLVPQFDGVTSGEWSLEAMTYVPEDSNDGITDIGFLSRHLGFQDAADTQWFGAFRLHMASDFAGGLDGGLPIIRDQWVPMQTIFDIDAQTYETFYDGEFANSGSWDGDNALVGLDVWSEDNASTMYYDDFKVAPVTPELPGDFDGDGVLGASDIDLLSAEVRMGERDLRFDLNGDSSVDQVDRTIWVEDLKTTWFGDANLDGEFNSGDLVTVFTAGEYEDRTPLNSTWATGDWDGNGDFASGDLVVAFQDGGYELGPRVAANAVPEPASFLLLMAGLAGFAIRRRHAGR